MTPEVWRPIVGYEGWYAVSSSGRIRGLDRIVIRRNGIPFHCQPRILRTRLHNKSGRQYVKLSRRGKTQTLFIRNLVAQAFADRPTQ
jgi:hypothetical protein